MKLEMCLVLEVIWLFSEGHLGDETGYVSRSGGHQEVIWWLPEGYLENETGYESRSGGHLEVIWLLLEGHLEFWRMKLVMCPDLEVTWRLVGCYP